MSEKHITFDAIGTRWHVQAQTSSDDETWTQLQERIQTRIQAFDVTYSRFRADSLMTEMSKRSDTYDLPADGYELLNFYEKLYRATDGAVTPLIGQVMTDAGYDATYSFKAKELHTPDAWEDVISYTNTTITLKKPALLDFGAAGKGYLVDIVSGLLQEAGIHTYFINAGGDILHHDTNNEMLPVGLENPLDTTEAVGIAQLGNQSLCASASNKRVWGNYHHIIDPRSLQSPSEIIATWVIADDTMTADGIATALFFTDPTRLQEHFPFTFAILHKDMTMHCADTFPVTLFESAQ